jgi:type IV pilus assembly protein PilE
MNTGNWRQKTQGFTITELMITIAIVGILVAVAVPSYQDYLRRSQRADAKITLENLAAAQETYYFRNNKYAAKFSALRMVEESVVTLPSEQGYFAITLTADDFSWSMLATALGQQVEDTQCIAFTLTHLGVHGAFDTDGLASTTCW